MVPEIPERKHIITADWVLQKYLTYCIRQEFRSESMRKLTLKN